MEIKNISTFLKIVEFNNFTRAAESLGYSQAAVTAQIKALESELGVPLFDRVGKRIYLTHQGKAFLPYAKRILNDEAEALESVRPGGTLKGELTICSASSYASKILPGILLEFRRLHPEVVITVKVSDFVDDNIQKLRQGEIDFLTCLDEPKTYEGLQVATNAPVSTVFVTHPGNPLLKKKKHSISQVIESEFIASDREIGYCALLERELGRRGMELKPAMEIGSVDAIIRVIRGGYGTALLPEYMVKDHLRTGELLSLDVTDLKIELTAPLLCSGDRWLSPVMKEYIRIVDSTSF